jgi:diadenosine tetraphosphatase ApaH/serine/threonine PP2A family protein phosphatase
VIALISDVHGNVDALDAVFADIDRLVVDEVVCLGDMVGYGPEPDAAVDRVRGRARLAILGNHDWALLHHSLGMNVHARAAIARARDAMAPGAIEWFGRRRERWSWLAGLRSVVEERNTLFVHGSPRDPLAEYVFGDRHVPWNPEATREMFSRVRRVCFCGHSHFPVVVDDTLACAYPTDGEPTIALAPGRRYIVNVGSAGQPRDGDPRACYALFGGECVTYRRVAYDVRAAMRKLAGQDGALAERLAIGL